MHEGDAMCKVGNWDNFGFSEWLKALFKGAKVPVSFSDQVSDMLYQARLTVSTESSDGLYLDMLTQSRIAQFS